MTEPLASIPDEPGTAPAPLPPEMVSAILRDPNSTLFPSQITVFCDHCGHEHTGDHMVSEDMTRAERLAVARKHLVANEGWQCDEDGDFCPEHAGSNAQGEATADHPFTDDDLRAAAALMHYALTTTPNPADAGAALADNPRWLLVTPYSEQEEQLRESVVELVSGAADVSRWAVDLGADGLEADEHQLTVGAGEKPIARIHFAFEPGMDDDMRTSLVQGIAQAIDAHL